MKIALISDLHFGIKKSDTVFQKSQLRFFEKQLVEELKLRGINTIFVLGDVFDTRQAVNVQTSNVVLKLFKDTFRDFTIHMIVGNHDLYYTDTTEVNSLKQLDLLPNVKVYEDEEQFELDGHSITMLPWITDYKNVGELPSSEYCFAHLDVSGFMMDKYNMCSNGLSVKSLANNFKHVFTGHFHTRSKKKIGDCCIEYIGSPYQLTRIDAGQDRGCTVLDLDTAETELIVNTESIRFVKLTYPDIPENLDEIVKHNIVDVDIPYDLSDESKKILDYTQALNAACPINITQNIGKKPELTVEHQTEDLSNIDLFSLFKTYVDQLSVINKDEIYKELTSLYNDFKRRITCKKKQLHSKMVKLKAFTNILLQCFSKMVRTQYFLIWSIRMQKSLLQLTMKLSVKSIMKQQMQILQSLKRMLAI